MNLIATAAASPVGGTCRLIAVIIGGAAYFQWVTSLVCGHGAERSVGKYSHQ